MHDELGIMHRDLKPDNIMINENPLCAKIIDFGTCKDLTVESGPHTSYVSTRWYRAPECVLRSHHYTFVSDVFAAGCIMGELYLQHPLFPGSSELDQVDKILRILGTPSREQWRDGYKLAEKRDVHFDRYVARPLGKYLPGISEDALEVIKAMLKISAHNRATASMALAMPFFDSKVFTPSSQDSHYNTAANMSQSPPNTMHGYMKTNSLIERRRLQGDSAIKTQRGQQEGSSLHYAGANRHLYNNTDSVERGNGLNNDGSSFYTAKKQNDLYPNIHQSKDLFIDNQYLMPMSRKHPKGSSSLVGGNNNLSSRDSSTGTGTNIPSYNLRAGYDSQVRNQFS